MALDPTANPVPRLIPSTRFILALLVSFSLFVQYSQRVSLSMAIVCMVNRTAIHSESINATMNSMPTKYGPSFITEKQFAWTEFQQQILLGAYWFGYIFTLASSNQTTRDSSVKLFVIIVLLSLLGGWLAITWGPKRLVAISILLSSIATVAIPVIYFIENYQFYFALAFRVVIGFTHGPLFPATYVFWSMWAVPLERSTLTSIGFCSTNLGTCQ